MPDIVQKDLKGQDPLHFLEKATRSAITHMPETLLDESLNGGIPWIEQEIKLGGV